MLLLTIAVAALALTIFLLMKQINQLHRLIQLYQELDSENFKIVRQNSIYIQDQLSAIRLDVANFKFDIESLNPIPERKEKRPANRKDRTTEQKKKASEMRKKWWEEKRKKERMNTSPQQNTINRSLPEQS